MSRLARSRPAPRVALSPINARRWQNFKANRRGYWSFWIFLILFVISLFAEFIANDKPIYIHVDGKNYFPVFVTYPDTDFRRRCSAPRPTTAIRICSNIWPNTARHGRLAAGPFLLRHHHHDLPSPAFRRSRPGC